MANPQNDIKEYFTFSKSQSQGIILLSILCVLGIGVYFSMPYWVSPPKQEASNDAEVEKILASIYIDSSGYTKKEYKPQQLTPFNFNPNTLSEEGFIKLGLRPRLAQTILNYRNKGGRFYKKEDFKKIWGLHEDEYKQLLPYISIPKSQRTYAKSDYKKYPSSNTNTTQKNLNIEINAATAEQLMALHDIAEKLASNILKYRKMLGGFYSTNQLKEVYGIRPETFENIKRHLKCNASAVQKININEATLNEMNAHPYLRKGDWGLAIVKFRKSQDYEIKALEDLKQIDGMTTVIYNKLTPYLKLK